ncbi:MAG TPA: hypothetical protein ENJ09_13090 [Planctomycetes bacterium]|nr:hypothetical protein [Planctomycetota bacterium]
MAPGDEKRAEAARLTTAHRMNRLLAEAQERVLALVDDEGPTEPRISKVRAARNCVFVLVGMCVVFWGLSAFQERVAPEAVYDEASMQRFKVRSVAERADEFDLFFVGTSRVYRTFDPVLFEELTGEAGSPVHAYNMGLRGMPLPEMRHTVEWLLSRHPRRLRYVVMELTGDLTRTFGRPLHLENAYTDRVVAWHDAEETRLLIAANLDSAESLGFKVEAVATHLAHFLRRFTSTGIGLPLARVLLHLPELEPESPWPETGQVTFEDEVAGDPVREAAAERWLEIFRANRGEYEALLAELRTAPRSGPLDPHLLSGIRDIAAKVRAAGAVPIFVVMPPHWADGLEVLEAGGTDLGGPLLYYGNPERFPEFYDYDNLYNLRHLNGKGTELFTRRFAADFLRLEEGR